MWVIVYKPTRVVQRKAAALKMLVFHDGILYFRFTSFYLPLKDPKSL